MTSDSNADKSATVNSLEDPASHAQLFQFGDEFVRENSDDLGDGWEDAHHHCPAHFEPLGIFDNGVVITNPTARPGVYDSRPPAPHPLPDNQIHPGIGCAWTETGATRVAVKVIWSGNFGVKQPVPVSHVEATPLLFVNPESSRFGFGAWFSQLYGRTVMFAGYIGSPPEDFDIVAIAHKPGPHVPGTPREVELRVEKPGAVTVWVDGEQINFDSGAGLSPIEVDPSMIGSTLHGFAVDAHLVDPLSDIPTLKGVEAITIIELK